MFHFCPCRYFKVLIQEMDLRMDLGFLYAVLELLTAEHASAVTSEQEVALRSDRCDVL